MSFSAKDIIDAIRDMPNGEKRKVLEHLSAAQRYGGNEVTQQSPSNSVHNKKAVNGFMAFRCKWETKTSFIKATLLKL